MEGEYCVACATPAALTVNGAFACRDHVGHVVSECLREGQTSIRVEVVPVRVPDNAEGAEEGAEGGI